MVSCLRISNPGAKVILVVGRVAGSTAADRAARDVVSALFVRVALRVVVVDCVDDVQGTESLKTRPGSMSESSPLESYDIFRDFECWAKSRGARGEESPRVLTPFALLPHFGRSRIFKREWEVLQIRNA